MKKIIYVINVDWYFKLHWLNRAVAAQRNGYRITVATHFTSVKNQEYFESLGFTCLDVDFSRSGLNPFHEIRTVFTLYRLLKRHEPDLVHCITIKPSIYGGLVSGLLKVPSIKSITGLGAVFSSNSYRFRVLRPLIIGLYYLVGQANKGAFIFENKQDLNIFKRSEIGRNQALIHIGGAGVDTSRFYPTSKPLDNLRTNKKLSVLFAARLLKDKGLDTLISAVKRLQDSDIVVELWVAGLFDLSSRNAYSYEEVEQLSNEGTIKWLGSVNGDAMASVLNKVDVVALPTRYGEGIPRILIEGGATGRIVIASNVSGCNELLTDGVNGRLLSPMDAEEWRACICDIISDPCTYQHYANKLLHEVRTVYSDNMVISKFLHIYKQYSK
ncbi:glycosyltransferase family 4 protein [Vibrio superstes]|uniref:Galactosyl transferase n=1 Tax=Vibrio superstes NBRC 103154 TaxID=1219062 RepID=A0A511QU38_9VIBR|nr:glycosyltransferase family 4 protein [Vibrio superstes]GEM80860.1 galactosyl transferase [Vibrio superstes NBRC 103154]